MCHFKSAWYLESGELVHCPETDGHEHLALARGIKQGFCGMDRAVRVELLPPANIDDIADISKWNLHLDELTAPDWWEDKKDDCLRQISAVVKGSIVTDERACLIGGSWILTKTAIVHAIVGGRIISAVGANLNYAYLENANLYSANLYSANLENANLYNAYLKNAYLRNANLEKAYLKSANLENANLENANLGNAYLENTNLENANLENANLGNAYLENTNLKSADLENANLGNAYLGNANLESANLKNANLENANLGNANLENANLKNANLENANLKSANLENANLKSAYRLADDKAISGWQVVDGRLHKV